MILTAPRLDASPARAGVAPLARHFALAGLTAILLALAFPRPGLGLLAHVALVPVLLLSLRSQGVWRLLWTTYLVNVTWWLVMIRWMYPVTVGGTIGLSAYMAIYLPLFALAIRFLSRRFSSGMVVAVPMVWVSLELMRCEWLEGGFAWFALAHTQMPMPGPGLPRALGASGKLVQVADLFSQYGVSFLVAMTNGLVADLLTRRWVRRDELTGRSRPRRTVLAAALLWALAMIGAMIYGQRCLDRDLSAAPTINVALVQTNVPQSNRNYPTPESQARDWRRLQELTRAAAASSPRPDLIVWPESVAPAALNPEAIAYYTTAQTGARGNEIVHQQLGELAREIGISIVAGADAYFDWRVITGPDGKQFEVPTRRFNSAYLYRPDGSQSSLRYDKMHLVPFGEYIPWVRELPWLQDFFFHYISPYDFDYTLSRGTRFTVFEAPIRRAQPAPGSGGGLASTQPGLPAIAAASTAPAGIPAEVRIGTPICFEDVYPDTVRAMIYGPNGRKHADLLANLTNDGWFFFEYDEPWMHAWYGLPVGWLVGWLGASHQAEQEFQSAAIRCIETRVPMVRSVNTGVSGFIDSAGRIGPIVTDPFGRQKCFDDTLVAPVRLDPHGTLFGLLGYTPIHMLMGLTALWIVSGFFRTPKMRTNPGVHA
ncbi:MAG: apolipoprotein N-acyltransferase [Planctomycetota bacterium]|nr:apolipoprotein N-acyltransferase [Planctomycetota bacterium]